MKVWTLKLDRTQEGYFRNFDGPSIEGPEPIEVVQKQEYDKLKKVLESIRDDYDHDSDAHKYGTPCRVCEADKAVALAAHGSEK